MYRLGGWIQTTRSDDGFTFEHGPRTVRPAGPKGANTLELIEDLGIEDRIVPIKYGHPATVNRMVCVNGELHKLPSNLKSIFTTQPPFSKPLFLAGVKEFFTTQKKCPDESIYDFVQRRFGSVNVTSAVNFSRIKLHIFTHKNLASITYFYRDSKKLLFFMKTKNGNQFNWILELIFSFSNEIYFDFCTLKEKVVFCGVPGMTCS